MIGLASGDRSRPFSERELEALSRFAQLASIALDNARLFERAQTEGLQRAHAALHDMLTGLPNRTLLLNRMAEHLDAGPSASDGKAQRSRVALILLDLDRFKVVNESLGHAAGDLLLAEVARPARRRPPARTDVVARLGSDEFGVLLGPVRSVREAERVAARITAAVAVPFDLDGQEVIVGASIGLAVGRPADDVRRRPAQGGGDRPPSGEARPGPQVRHVRPGDARRDARPGDPRARPPARHRALRAARPLPAARRPRHRRGRGPRGARSAGSTRPAASSRRCRSSRSPRRPA